ncbi:MAG: protoporphyrinogen oxidase [Acidobacteriales bacterium]|nr:protoporphyrinogen oxidase [Terriglobales bacterium]
MPRVAIIGGGISGLSAAYSLEQARRGGTPVEYVVYEAAPRLGGVLVTDHVDGCLVEAGPDSFVTEKPWAADLCRKIGLGDQLIGSNDADRKTYILVNGRLVVMPDGLMFMVPTKILPTVFSPLFSFSAKLRMAREWFHPPHRAPGDESVAAMVERHYGREMVDRLADPLLSGIYGGTAEQLSVRAALPRFADMEAKHGSLGRAMLAARAKMPKTNGPPRPLFTSLRDGMQTLVDAILPHLEAASLRVGVPVSGLQRDDQAWTVTSGGATQKFDAVILATPARAAAPLMAAAGPELSRELADIQYSSSITVALGYDAAVRRSLPPAFGFLVPRGEGKQMLAATFVHNKFPHRAPDDRALLRCFLAGQGAEKMMNASDDELVGIIRRELREIIGLSAEPRFARVYRWKSAMAQYSVGHLERLDRIAALLEKLPSLALAGNGYRGIGVPDCVRTGTEAAARVLTAVGLEQPKAGALSS